MFFYIFFLFFHKESPYARLYVRVIWFVCLCILSKYILMIKDLRPTNIKLASYATVFSVLFQSFSQIDMAR